MEVAVCVAVHCGKEISGEMCLPKNISLHVARSRDETRAMISDIPTLENMIQIKQHSSNKTSMM